jgi:hypothetical protein
MRETAIFTTAFTLLFASAAAEACRVLTPPQQRVERGIADGTINAVAIVTVAESRYLQPRLDGMHPWRASADVTRVLQGKQLPDTVKFERGWGSAACEWNLPDLPKPGDQWVIYFWRDQTAGLKPWLAMPLAEAKALDPRLMTR